MLVAVTVGCPWNKKKIPTENEQAKKKETTIIRWKKRRDKASA